LTASHLFEVQSILTGISMVILHRHPVAIAIFALAAITSQSFAEQIDAPVKARRVSNRHIPLNRIAEQPVSSSLETPLDYEAQLDEEFFDDDSVVVQAGCKNCSSSNGGEYNLAQESSSSPEEYYQESPEHVSYAPSTMGGVCGSCSDSSCDALGCCGVNPCSPFGMLATRLYLRAESAQFWGSGQALPTLVTTDGTSLFGGTEIGTASVPGFRSEAGIWLDECQSRAIVVRGFYGGDNDLGLTTDSTAFANLELPFLSHQPCDARRSTHCSSWATKR
jgi:hypothetical protein